MDARVVVNATGVWADDVQALEEGARADTIRPAKGIHITVPWDGVRNDIAAVVPVPKDRRSVFVVPWPGADEAGGGEGSVTYIGTTDTDYDGESTTPMHAGRRRLPTGGPGARCASRSPSPTSSPPGPGCGPWWATATAAPPTCPGATG